jgi:hypothetical protein
MHLLINVSLFGRAKSCNKNLEERSEKIGDARQDILARTITI